MPEPIDDLEAAQIRQIVSQLARKKGLSAEEAEEIGGHLEDKLLAYLSGEVRITPADALLLARAHFGDASGVARQVADSADACAPESRRRKRIRRTAAQTALCTLVLFPMTLLLFGQAPENLRNLTTAVLIIVAGLGVIEAGVLLAVRTDLTSRWQRAVAAGFLMPSMASLSIVLLSGMSVFVANFGSPSRGGYGIIAATVFASLLGHFTILLYLAVPLPTKTSG